MSPEKSSRVRSLLLVAILLYGGLGLAQLAPYSSMAFLSSDVLQAAAGVLIAGSVLALFGLLYGPVFQRYFQSLLGVRSDGFGGEPTRELQALIQEIRGLRASTSPSPPSLSEAVEREVLNLYQKALDDKFAVKISTQLQSLVREKFNHEVEFEAARYLQDVNVRLSAASSTVSARGFLNLVLGILSAAAALYVLQQAIWLLKPEQLTGLPLSTVIYLTATRVSLALVITLVSYFFLSLYKKSLEDAKFYQNEMTDMSSRAAALQLALYMGDPGSRVYVLQRLIESDRNRFVVSSQRPEEEESSLGEIAKKLIDKLPTIKSE